MADKTHEYFTVLVTSAQPEEGRHCIHFQEAPRRDEAGKVTTMSMRWPGLIVADGVADAEAFAQAVADVLNENAHRFFSSAVNNG